MSLRTLAAFLALTVSAFAAERAPDFASALALAQGKPDATIVVLLHGSDWCPPGEPLAKRWTSGEFAGAVSSEVILVAVDRPEKQTDETKALAKKNEKCAVAAQSYPAIAVYDRDGRLFGLRDGLAEITGMGELTVSLGRVSAARRQRDQLWAEAEKMSGPAKAEKLGAGLDLMSQGLGPKDVYKPILEALKKADPEDATGYAATYTFNGRRLLETAVSKGKDSPAEVEAELNVWSAKKRLSTRQRQELEAARFALYERWPQKKDERKKVLERMHSLDPKSDLGQAAESYLKILAKG